MLIQNGADPSLKAKGGLRLVHFAAEREKIRQVNPLNAFKALLSVLYRNIFPTIPLP